MLVLGFLLNPAAALQQLSLLPMAPRSECAVSALSKLYLFRVHSVSYASTCEFGHIGDKSASQYPSFGAVLCSCYECTDYRSTLGHSLMSRLLHTPVAMPFGWLHGGAARVFITRRRSAPKRLVGCTIFVARYIRFASYR